MKKYSLLALYALLFIPNFMILADEYLEKHFEEHFTDTMDQKFQKALVDREKAKKNLDQAEEELLSTEEGKEYYAAEEDYNEWVAANGKEPNLGFSLNARTVALKKLQQRPEYTEKYLPALDKYTYESYKVESLNAVNNTIARYNKSKFYIYDRNLEKYKAHSTLFNSNKEAVRAGMNSVNPRPSTSQDLPKSLLSLSNDRNSIHAKVKSDLEDHFDNSFASPFSKSDAAKAAQHMYCVGKVYDKTEFPKQRMMFYMLPAIAAIRYDDHMYLNDHPAVNLTKHYLWYRPMAGKLSQSDSLAGKLTTPIAFVSADMALKKAANTLNQFEKVNSFTQNISEKTRQFLYQNGKLVVASACAELARTAVEQGSAGMTSANTIKFGKKAGMQFGVDFVEKYGVEPLSHHLFGKEDSNTKTAFNLGTNAAMVLGLHYMFGETATIDFDLTPATSLRIEHNGQTYIMQIPARNQRQPSQAQIARAVRNDLYMVNHTASPAA